MAEKIVLATHNAGKIREFKSILEPLGYEAVSVHDVIADITEPEETGTTFAENALLKATYYMKATGLPCLADDSGIAADALGGRPGVYSARYAGQNGFGYDPLFYVPDKGKTMAELSMAEKNEISHRGKALKKLVEALS